MLQRVSIFRVASSRHWLNCNQKAPSEQTESASDEAVHTNLLWLAGLFAFRSWARLTLSTPAHRWLPIIQLCLLVSR